MKNKYINKGFRLSPGTFIHHKNKNLHSFLTVPVFIIIFFFSITHSVYAQITTSQTIYGESFTFNNSSPTSDRTYVANTSIDLISSDASEVVMWAGGNIEISGETTLSGETYSGIFNNPAGSSYIDNYLNTVTVPGSTAGAFSVNSGTASYGIPITVTPGTAGMQPKLSINYNSGGGNNYLGLGFGLGEIPKIKRGAADETNHTVIDGMDFDDNDKFFIDGQLLLCISGTYGANGAEYRLRNDNFTKYVSYGTAGSGPAYFKAWTKDGLIYEFANTGNSRIEAQGRSDVIFWAVNKISDTKGNYMTFTYYENNSTGESYISQIDYTGNATAGLSPYNSVKFNYESRPDIITKYYLGCKMTISKRLQNIKIYNETDIVRTYNLAYQNINHKSQLISVQEFGSNGTCFKPTTFEWEVKPPGTYQTDISNAPNTTVNFSDNTKEFASDVNGDGLVDIIFTRQLTTALEVYVCFSNGDGTFASAVKSTVHTGNNYSTAAVFMGNGDKYGSPGADIFWIVRTGDRNGYVYISRSLENGTYTTALKGYIHLSWGSVPNSNYTNICSILGADMNCDKPLAIFRSVLKGILGSA